MGNGTHEINQIRCMHGHSCKVRGGLEMAVCGGWAAATTAAAAAGRGACGPLLKPCLDLLIIAGLFKAHWRALRREGRARVLQVRRASCLVAVQASCSSLHTSPQRLCGTGAPTTPGAHAQCIANRVEASSADSMMRVNDRGVPRLKPPAVELVEEGTAAVGAPGPQT